MQISKISMMNSFRTNSVAMRGFKEDTQVLRKLDNFMSENDLFLRADVYPKNSGKSDLYHVTLYANSDYDSFGEKGKVPMYRSGLCSGLVKATGRDLKEAKLNLIKEYGGEELTAPGNTAGFQQIMMPYAEL